MQFKKEPLGTETMEGVQVDGTRMTITTPAGLEGNDRPLTRFCKHWLSPELKVTILSKCSDPRTGQTTMSMRNLFTMAFGNTR